MINSTSENLKQVLVFLSILVCMRQLKFHRLRSVKHEQSFITSGPGLWGFTRIMTRDYKNSIGMDFRDLLAFAEPDLELCPSLVSFL